jgi:hypothetical protein
MSIKKTNQYWRQQLQKLNVNQITNNNQMEENEKPKDAVDHFIEQYKKKKAEIFNRDAVELRERMITLVIKQTQGLVGLSVNTIEEADKLTNYILTGEK